MTHTERPETETVPDAASLAELVRSAKVGDALKLKATRDGEEVAIDVTIGDQASAEAATPIY